MADLFTKYKTIIYVLAGVLVAGGAWYMFGSSGGQSSDVLTTQNLTDTNGVVDKDLVETLLQLRAVSLSGTILSDPGFVSLKDFGTQIVPEPVGRPNPFAPIASSSSVATPARTNDLFSGKRQ